MTPTSMINEFLIGKNFFKLFSWSFDMNSILCIKCVRACVCLFCSVQFPLLSAAMAFGNQQDILYTIQCRATMFGTASQLLYGKTKLFKLLCTLVIMESKNNLIYFLLFFSSPLSFFFNLHSIELNLHPTQCLIIGKKHKNKNTYIFYSNESK